MAVITQPKPNHLSPSNTTKAFSGAVTVYHSGAFEATTSFYVHVAQSLCLLSHFLSAISVFVFHK
jgi:hypothetical protein